VVAENSYHHDRSPQRQGRSGLEEALRTEGAALTESATTVEAVFGADDVVLHRWTRSARQTGAFHGLAPSGRAVTASGLTLSRVRAGRIAEDWQAEDVGEQIRQLSGSAPLGGLDALPDPDRTEATRAAAIRFVYDLWNGGDLALVDELFDPAFTNHTPLPGQLPGRAGARQFVGRWRAAFPDVAVTVDLLVADGNQSAIRWTSRGHHEGPIFGIAPADRYVTVSGITVLVVRDGRISEQWQQWDLLSFLEQATAPPAPGPPATTDPRS
jgi:predicted ester cyclase